MYLEWLPVMVKGPDDNAAVKRHYKSIKIA